MIKCKVHADPDGGKGWFFGPWDSSVPESVGWADRGVNEPHRHEEMNEVYLVAHGTSVAVVAGREVRLVAGDVLVVWNPARTTPSCPVRRTTSTSSSRRLSSPATR